MLQLQWWKPDQEQWETAAEVILQDRGIHHKLIKLQPEQ